MIKFTQQACDFFTQQSLRNQQIYWVISLRKVGCSGYQYDVKWQNEPVGDPIAMGAWYVCMDAAWMHVLQGVTVDIKHDALGQKKVVYENPMTKAQCGCGESFMLVESS